MSNSHKFSYKFKIPKEVSRVTKTLENAGFEAYIVGGCVRDLLRGKAPKDWDATTNAKPEEIEKLFENTFYNNDFGTVGVVNEDTKDESLKVVEVTPYRLESEYSDARRPDSVEFSDSLEHDLHRRDFTINAIAYSVSKGQIVDSFKGQEDIKDKIIRAVGDADVRFKEDALRILRAIRISVEIGFKIEKGTENAIKKDAKMLQKIAKERIRDEFSRILMSDSPKKGIETMERLDVLKYVVPELLTGKGVGQMQTHKFDVYEHNLRTLQHSALRKWSLDVRLASLFHDISKTETRRWSDKNKQWSFHGHDVVGARKTIKILSNLKFPKKTIEKVSKLVRWHLFFSDTEKVTLSAVRRTIRNVGRENIWDLMNLRACDRIGTGRPKEHPYRFRKYKAMVEEALHDPISVTMLKIDGKKIMEVSRETPGPKIGYILHALLEDVLDDPKLNTAKYLEKRTKELIKLSENELKNMGEKGRQKKEKVGVQEVKKMRDRYWVE